MPVSHWDVRVGESLLLDGGRIKVTVEEKSGQRARLSIDANKDVQIEKEKRPVRVPAQRGLAPA